MTPQEEADFNAEVEQRRNETRPEAITVEKLAAALIEKQLVTAEDLKKR